MSGTIVLVLLLMITFYAFQTIRSFHVPLLHIMVAIRDPINKRKLIESVPLYHEQMELANTFIKTWIFGWLPLTALCICFALALNARFWAGDPSSLLMAITALSFSAILTRAITLDFTWSLSFYNLCDLILNGEEDEEIPDDINELIDQIDKLHKEITERQNDKND